MNELRSRCDLMNEKQKRSLVLELLAQDAQSGLDDRKEVHPDDVTIEQEVPMSRDDQAIEGEHNR